MSSMLRAPRKLRAAISVVASLMLVLGLAGAAFAGTGINSVNSIVPSPNTNNFDISPAPLTLTISKYICTTYRQVPANGNPTNEDATGGHGGEVGLDDPVNCKLADGWSFGLYASQNATTPIETTAATSGGSVTVTLNAQEIDLARNGAGALWVQEVTQNGTAGFGAIRCYGDAINGDNLEQIRSVPFDVPSITCTAYNVQQVITFTAGPTGVTVGASGFSVSASATSTLPVTYSSTTPSICSVNAGNGALTLLAVGTCKIAANQGGQNSPFWAPAPQVTHDVAIGKVDLSVTGPTTSQPYGTATSTFTPIYSGFVPGDGPSTLGTQPTCSSGTNASSPAGDYAITCSGGVSNKYNFNYIAGKLTIGKVDQAITFAIPSAKTYGDPSFGLGASASSGLPVTYTPDSIDGSCTVDASGIVTITGVGTCTITASQSGDVHWNAATSKQRSFAIGKAVLTATAEDKSRAFGAANPELTYTITGFVNSETSSVVSGVPDLSTTAAPASPLNTYPITVAINTLTATNYSFSLVNGMLTVVPAGLDHIGIKPKTATIVAGATQAYIAEAFDIGGNSLGDVTGSTVFTIGSGASCTAAVCTSNTAATYTVTGTYLGKTDTATLIVTAGGLDHFVISPSPKTIVVDTTQTYTAEAFDANGNSLGDVTASTTFTIDGTGSSCAVDKCGSSVVGDYTVTGTYQGEWTSTAVLHVTAVPPTAAPSATPVEQVGGATATPARVATPPVTSSNGSSPSNDSPPLMLLLIALAFSGLGMLAVQTQRGTIRR